MQIVHESVWHFVRKIRHALKGLTAYSLEYKFWLEQIYVYCGKVTFSVAPRLGLPGPGTVLEMLITCMDRAHLVWKQKHHYFSTYILLGDSIASVKKNFCHLHRQG
jgi:hypothetical protein